MKFIPLELPKVKLGDCEFLACVEDCKLIKLRSKIYVNIDFFCKIFTCRGKKECYNNRSKINGIFYKIEEKN